MFFLLFGVRALFSVIFFSCRSAFFIYFFLFIFCSFDISSLCFHSMCSLFSIHVTNVSLVCCSISFVRCNANIRTENRIEWSSDNRRQNCKQETNNRNWHDHYPIAQYKLYAVAWSLFYFSSTFTLICYVYIWFVFLISLCIDICHLMLKPFMNRIAVIFMNVKVQIVIKLYSNNSGEKFDSCTIMCYKYTQSLVYSSIEP